MVHYRNLMGVALATLLSAFVATTAQADERKSSDAKKDGTASTGLLVANAAHDFGAAFSRDKDKCEDDDKDKDHGGVRKSSNKGKHRPPCDDDDDDDDDDDCDGGHHDHGNGHGHGHGHHKPPKDCHPSPSR